MQGIRTNNHKNISDLMKGWSTLGMETDGGKAVVKFMTGCHIIKHECHFMSELWQT